MARLSRSASRISAGKKDEEGSYEVVGFFLLRSVRIFRTPGSGSGWSNAASRMSIFKKLRCQICRRSGMYCIVCCRFPTGFRRGNPPIPRGSPTVVVEISIEGCRGGASC